MKPITRVIVALLYVFVSATAAHAQPRSHDSLLNAIEADLVALGDRVTLDQAIAEIQVRYGQEAFARIAQTDFVQDQLAQIDPDTLDHLSQLVGSTQISEVRLGVRQRGYSLSGDQHSAAATTAIVIGTIVVGLTVVAWIYLTSDSEGEITPVE